ncbi:hypothetical protein FRC03_007166 [Tulasnella sp. 419]|nr:hypothetical protein FRC03_007166 [Tulasnella sp. 419]
MSGSGLSHQKSTSRSSVFSSNSKPNDEDSGALHESLAGLSKSIDDLSILRLKGALEGVIDVIKAAKAGKNKQTDVEDLRSHIERLESSIIRPLKEARMTMSLQTRLEILTNDLEQIRVDYQKRSGKGRFGKFLTIGDKSMTLGNVGSMINKASQSFLSDSHLHVPVAAKEFVFTQAEKALLNRLPNADARFNSAARKAAPSCLENTRVALLKEVFAWIDSSDNKEKIYWLHGLAGTGKSTVANTVASRLAQQDRLGASFFFSRDVEERRDPLRVLPSIARQFAEFSPEYKGHLVKSLDGRKDAGKSALPIQMERLFVIPLRSMGAQQTPLIVVMDALDECDNNQLVTTLLRLLSEFILTNPEINLKIFITSRPEPHIEAAFRRGSANQVSKPFVLHDIERSIVQADIKVYLRYELEKVARAYKISKQWPSNRELNELVERAGGLFIAASTSIKFIADPRERQPERRLQALLSEKRAPGQAPYKDLDQVYYRVLGAVVQGRKDPNDELCVRFRDVVGTIITVLDPLPPRALQHLLGCNIDVITSTVVPLRSVIIVPSNAESDTDQLRVFHLSFPNFLTERCTDPRFIIDSMLRHHRLALSCITLLSSFLKRNVCQLPDSLKLNSEVSDLEERLKNVVPMHYQYASRHWGFHLRAISEAVNAPKPRDAATQQVLDRITDSCQHLLREESTTMVGGVKLAWLA